MNKQKSKSDISGIKLKVVSHNTRFAHRFVKSPREANGLIQANQIQAMVMSLAPAVDESGELFYPETAIIFFNN
jgi:hypothetical protein